MTEEYMRGYTEGFEKGYATAIASAASLVPTPNIRLCPVCGLMEGDACYLTTPCYYGANKNR
jgi:hypothetical protein